VTPTDPSFYKELLDHMSDGVYFVDRDRRILYWNEGAFRLTGYKAEELVGRCCQDDTLRHVDAAGRSLCQDGCPLTSSVDDGGPHEAQLFLRHKQGRRVPVAVRVQPIQAADGSVVGAVEIFSDDTAQHAARRKTEEMERLAFLDQLTQLPNRRYMEMSLQTALSEFQVHKDSFGVLVIDLDRFKAINDGFGHATGDRVLQEVAKTLTGALRPSDIVGRWGGDEFCAVVRHVNSETLRELAERCCVLVAQTSFPSSDGSPVSLSVSIGGTLALPSDTVEALIKRADELMYRSKTSGRGRASTE
jgi:diguanylate cyclase (GGDEF)-like protein/PAS domain S-box-containing protein